MVNSWPSLGAPSTSLPSQGKHQPKPLDRLGRLPRQANQYPYPLVFEISRRNLICSPGGAVEGAWTKTIRKNPSSSLHPGSGIQRLTTLLFCGLQDQSLSLIQLCWRIALEISMVNSWPSLGAPSTSLPSQGKHQPKPLDRLGRLPRQANQYPYPLVFEISRRNLICSPGGAVEGAWTKTIRKNPSSSLHPGSGIQRLTTLLFCGLQDQSLSLIQLCWRIALEISMVNSWPSLGAPSTSLPSQGKHQPKPLDRLGRLPRQANQYPYPLVFEISRRNLICSPRFPKSPCPTDQVAQVLART